MCSMKRRRVGLEPALVRLPTDLLQLVLSFAESSLPRILALQLINRHFRDLMSKPNMLNFASVTLRRPTEIPNLGAMAAGVRRVKFMFAATSLRALPLMSSLRSLDLSRCKLVNNETVNIVSSLSHLKDLNLSECPRITDLSKLSHLSLTSLDVSFCYELRSAPPIPTLETLNMISCNAVQSWEALAAMPNLSVLLLNGCPVNDASLRSLPSGLTHLDLQFCRDLTDACLPDVARSVKLKFLDLTGCDQLTCLQPLGVLKALDEVRLMFCRWLDGLNALSHMPHLCVIYAPYTELTCDALSNSFEDLPNLTYLELSHSRITHVAFRRPLPSLRKLELRSCHMLYDLSNLSFCSQLLVLNLSGCQMVNEHSLANLVHVPNLVNLDLNTCLELTDASLREVAKLSTLRTLNLSGCAMITNAGMEHVGALSTLEMLDLQGCALITDAGLHALSGLHDMRVLNLNFLASLTDAGLFALLPMTKLVSLHLDSCRKITDVGLNALRSLLQLTSLDLSRCRSVETLYPLRSVTSLRSINLTGCVRVTDASLLNLVQCKGLHVLHSNRKITKHGLSMMRESIAS